MEVREPERIRVVIQQPALPKYRVPVFAELARRPGISVTVIYGQSNPTIPNVAAEGFDAVCVPEKKFRIGRRLLFWHSPQWRCAKPREADVLILTWSLPYLSMVPGLLRAKTAGVPTILWGHGYSKREAAWRAKARRDVSQLATALLLYNHGTARQYIEQGVNPARVFVALNALDQKPVQDARTHWLNRPDELAQFRQDHRLDNAEVILFVSRLERENRVDLLLRAAHQLRATHPRLKVVIIGIGEDQARLVHMVDDLRLNECVQFRGAIYDEMQLAPWFLSARMFCYPANIGLSLLHAFGYGLPVVTSDRVTAQNPEIEAIEHEGNGLMYTDGDADALASALQRLLDDEDLNARLTAEAHRTATEKFTLSNMVDGMEAAVRYCASKRKA